MNKAELRRQYLEKRKPYTPEAIQWKSLQISMQFFSNFKPQELNYIHIFLPIARQNEVDTWPVIQHLPKNYPSLQIAIPKADIKTCSMESYLYQAGLQLQTNTWGVPEPQNGHVIAPDVIDMILLPLLVFDEQGYRVGYGKGFYDRYLSRCRKDIIKIGVSLEVPVKQIADVNEYDVRMDYCITPDKIWKFV